MVVCVYVRACVYVCVCMCMCMCVCVCTLLGCSCMNICTSCSGRRGAAAVSRGIGGGDVERGFVVGE